MTTATTLNPAGTQVSGTWEANAEELNQQIDTWIDTADPVLKAGLILTTPVVGDTLKADPRFAPYAEGIDVSTKIVAPVVIEHSVNGSVAVSKPIIHESVNNSFKGTASLENRASSISL